LGAVPMPSDDTSPMPVMTTRLLNVDPRGGARVPGYFFPFAWDSM
jgi:hypothetical protein